MSWLKVEKVTHKPTGRVVSAGSPLGGRDKPGGELIKITGALC